MQAPLLGNMTTSAVPRFHAGPKSTQRERQKVANAEDLVCPSQAGTVRDPGNLRKTLDRVLARVGLDWVKPHTFRKTVGTVIAREADLATAAAQRAVGAGCAVRRAVRSSQRL